MNDEQYDKLIKEIKELKSILLFQSLTTSEPLLPPNLVEYMRTTGVPEKELRLMLAARFGKKFVERYMESNG